MKNTKTLKKIIDREVEGGFGLIYFAQAEGLEISEEEIDHDEAEDVAVSYLEKKGFTIVGE